MIGAAMSQSTFPFLVMASTAVLMAGLAVVGAAAPPVATPPAFAVMYDLAGVHPEVSEAARG